MEAMKNFDLDALEIERFDIDDAKERMDGATFTTGTCFRTCTCVTVCKGDLVAQE